MEEQMEENTSASGSVTASGSVASSKYRPPKRLFGQREFRFEDEDVDVSEPCTRSIPPKRTVSFTRPTEFVNEFVLNRERQRNQFIFRGRKYFGIYCDSIGYFKKSVYFSENEKGTLSVCFSPNGKQVVVGFGSGAIKMFENSSFKLSTIVKEGKENGYATTCIRFLPESNAIFYASSAEGNVVCYNMLSDDFNVVINQTNSEINSFDINTVATLLVTGGSYPDVKVYDIQTNVLLKSFANKRGSENQAGYSFSEYHTKRVQAIKFLPDEPNMFLSGGWDKMLKIWDVRSKNGCIKTIIGPHISGDAIDVRGPILLTGAWEPKHTVNLWDLRTYSLIQDVVPTNMVRLTEGIFTFATMFFDNDKSNDLILHASLGYKSVDIISIKQNAVLHSFVSEKSCVALDSHGPHIVFGGTHNALQFVSFFMNILVDYRDRPVVQEIVNEDVNEEELLEEEGE